MYLFASGKPLCPQLMKALRQVFPCIIGIFSPSRPSSGITVIPALARSLCVCVNWICVKGLVEASKKIVGACLPECVSSPLMKGIALSSVPCAIPRE